MGTGTGICSEFNLACNLDRLWELYLPVKEQQGKKEKKRV